MKEILIISGKGGTGKTSLTACFARLSSKAVFCDCDVDASNLHLLLEPELQEATEFYAGWTPQFTAARCTRCGQCAKVCRFKALSCEKGVPFQLPGLCEGCGVCADHCPSEAVKLVHRHCGRRYRSYTPYGALFHAELFPGEENSGKLIAELRRTAREEAEKTGAELLLSDGPPGIGCPVISSMSGADLAVAVTEPTLSGLHDFKRVAELARQFELPVQLIINKWDLNQEISGMIAAYCRDRGIPEIGRVPFDPAFAECLRKNQTVLSIPDSPAALNIKEIWHKIKTSTL